MWVIHVPPQSDRLLLRRLGCKDGTRSDLVASAGVAALLPPAARANQTEVTNSEEEGAQLRTVLQSSRGEKSFKVGHVTIIFSPLVLILYSKFTASVTPKFCNYFRATEAGKF